MNVRRPSAAHGTVTYVLPFGFRKVLRRWRFRKFRDDVERIVRGPLFDAEWYERTYPDIRTSGMSAGEHYVRFGIWEDRDPSPLFSSRFYRRQVGPGNGGLLLHYLDVGDHLRCMPNPLFDTAWYRGHYEVPNGESALLHYLRGGVGSGMRPNALFDTAWVAAENIGAIPDGQDPLQFYLDRARYLTLRPCPFFDPAWYRVQCPDSAGYIPLAHYLAVGIRLGFSPHPSVDGDLLAERLASTPALV